MSISPLPFAVSDDEDETEKMSVAGIEGLLRIRHPAPEWATFCELPNGTGAYYNQRIDCFTVNTYPSKKWHSIAYEIKVSRADFLRELRDPSKRLFAEKVSGQSYFVMPSGIARVDEIPEGWGLLQVTKGGLRVVKAAQQRERSELPMSFMAGLLRRSGEEAKGSVAMWLHCGKEVDEEALLQIAKEIGGERLKYQIRDEIKAEDEYRRLADLESAVRERIGARWSITASEFEKWAEAGRPKKMPSAQRFLASRLKALRDDLGPAIEALEAEGMT